MTSVKVCGIRTARAAGWAVDAGADYLGLVLSPSRRQISPQEAERLIAAFPGSKFVAVGRHVTTEWIAMALGLGVWGVQVHGQAPADWVDQVHAAGRVAIATRLDPAADVVLIDNAVPGSGVAWRWDKPIFSRPIWLAGGLTPDNVAAVVQELAPEGVDVSSGVEIGGEKDAGLIRRFIEEVHHGDNRSA